MKPPHLFVYLPQAARDEVKQWAAVEKRNVSQFVLHALREWGRRRGKALPGEDLPPSPTRLQEDGAATCVTFDLEPGARVEVKVATEDGKDVAEIRVTSNAHGSTQTYGITPTRARALRKLLRELSLPS